MNTIPPCTTRMIKDAHESMARHVPMERWSGFFAWERRDGMPRMRRAVAVELRAKGYSLCEIAAMMHRPTHTAILWMLRRAEKDRAGEINGGSDVEI